MSDTWTIKAALDWTEGYLKGKGDENPRLSAQWLLSEATGLSRIELYARFDQPLSMSERDVLRDIVARRGVGEPLQYITGEVGFRHIMVKVRPGVLIPRPETEVLVSEALNLFPVARRGSSEEENESPPEILVADLCAGSGCIACSIAHEYAQARVIATDIEPEAIELGRENARLLGLSERVDFLECDLGAGISQQDIGCFDLVVSNPPYIPTAILSEIPREVSDFEPTLALDGGEDGLDIFRRIVEWSLGALNAQGALVVELHEDCLSLASQIAREKGFSSTRIVRDIAGRCRILVAQK